MTTALLLIDFQNDYFPNGRMPLEKSTEASQRAGIILQACREIHIPIIHIQHISTQPDATFLFPCTSGAEFHVNVMPIKNETIIKKHYPNSFKDTMLLNHLQKNGIRHLIVCGMMTHFCVDATVKAAFDLGYSCTLLQDACAAKDLEFDNTIIPSHLVQSAFFASLNYKYANILSTDQLLQQINSRATVAA